MHSVHGDEETLFQTRWTMSYLRGPLLREEIKRLTADDAAPAAATSPSPEAGAKPFHGGPRPILPPGIREVFFPPAAPVPADAAIHYEPHVLGRAIVRYSLAGAGIEEHRELVCLAPAGESLGESAWDGSDMLPEPPEIEPAPRPGSFAPLPPALAGPRGYATLASSLKGWLGRSSRLVAWKAPIIDEVSRPDEREGDFRGRIAHRIRERRDLELERVRAREASKLASLADRIERARQKLERERAEAQNQSLQTYVSIGSAVLTSLFGRKKISSTTIGKAATSMRSASRSARQQADVAHAEESLATLEEKRRQLEDELEQELERIRLDSAPERITLERLEIPARKTGTTVEEVVLAWVPRAERQAEAVRAW
jgi:hypothetical protein